MRHTGSKTVVLWIGPAPNSLGWLKSQVAQTCEVKTCSADACLDDEVINSRAGRLVVACQDRLSYPAALLDRLGQRFEEVPTAVAVGNWWDGWGRTGLRQASPTVLPWHRWWDGWVPWLEGIEGRLFDPCSRIQATSQVSSSIPAPLLRATQSASHHFLVVANCKSTAATWVGLAEQCGLKASSLSSSAFHTTTPNSASTAASWNFILWDDSSLDRASNALKWEHSGCFFQTATARFPGAIQCASYSFPRWRSWKIAMQQGAHEFFVKPSSGDALKRMLAARFA